MRSLTNKTANIKYKNLSVSQTVYKSDWVILCDSVALIHRNKTAKIFFFSEKLMGRTDGFYISLRINQWCQKPVGFNPSCHDPVGRFYDLSRGVTLFPACNNQGAIPELCPFPLPSPFPLSPPFPSLPVPLSFPLSSVPLLPWSGPLKPEEGWGSAVNSPSGVWVDAPADIDFGVFWEGKLIWQPLSNYYMDFCILKFVKLLNF